MAAIYSTRRLVSPFQVAKSISAAKYKFAKSRPCCTFFQLWKLGYSAEDIISNVFRVCKTMTELAEFVKLEFIKEIGMTHMGIVQVWSLNLLFIPFSKLTIG